MVSSPAILHQLVIQAFGLVGPTKRASCFEKLNLPILDTRLGLSRKKGMVGFFQSGRTSGIFLCNHLFWWISCFSVFWRYLSFGWETNGTEGIGTVTWLWEGHGKFPFDGSFLHIPFLLICRYNFVAQMIWILNVLCCSELEVWKTGKWTGSCSVFYWIVIECQCWSPRSRFSVTQVMQMSYFVWIFKV